MSKTKKSLLLSCLSMLLCATMLIGSTFAWFTDNASTGVNTIQAGTLDIGLYEMPKSGAFNYAELDSYTNLEQKQLTFRDKNGNENILWEPGATFMTQEFIIVNEGNLAAKMKININGMDATNKKLLDAIDFTFEACAYGDYRDANAFWMSLDDPNLMYSREFTLNPHQASSVMRVTAKMKETAGNEYQGLTLDGIGITVQATQAAKESDSFGNQYDADATYSTVVTNAAELKTAMANGGTVTLGNDIVVDETIIMPDGNQVVLDMNGKKMSIADVSVDPMIEMKTGSSLTITGNGTFDLEDNYYASFIFPRGDVTIENGTFLRDYTADESEKYGSFFVGISGGKGKLIIKDGYFDGGYYKEGDYFNNCRNLLNCSWGQDIKVYGGTFVGQNLAWGDEGMARTINNTSTYCQGTFLEGQHWEDPDIPSAYSITEGESKDGRPTYTVIYNP